MNTEVIILTGRSEAGDSSGDIAHAALEMACGKELYAKGQIAAARERFLKAIGLDDDNPTSHVQLAICDWDLGSIDSAGEHLRTAIVLNPEFAEAQASLGQWFLLQGMVDLALAASAKSLELEPDNNHFMEMRAWVLEAAGDIEGAGDLVDQLIARGHQSIAVTRLFGRMARFRGQEEQALKMVLSKRMETGDSLIGNLDYIAADLLDSLGRYDEAFAHADRANSKQPFQSHAATHERRIDRLIAYFSKIRLESLPKATYRQDRPVFIVGMPRSGTSLLEQILAAHPAVHGAGELDFVSRVTSGALSMLSATEEDFPECLDALSIEIADGMAQIYLEPLNLLSSTASRIIDKLPYNFMHLGLISILLPGAKIIHCRRDPLDTCLSCYMTAFNMDAYQTRELTSLGRFYRQYERLMAHWKQVLEVPILEVFYEQVITEPEAQSRRMVEFLGLPWDDRCLEFHNNKRPVATASMHQVRKPIYNSSVQRWRHYEKYLGPLKAALGLS